jgi:hypothetical protein
MEERNEKLWKLAKKRANTKRNGLIYVKDNDSLIEKEYNKLIKKNNNESTI